MLTMNNLIEQMSINAIEKHKLFSASFELTSRCNQKCNMCYLSVPANDREVKARELTAAQWIRLAEEARDAGLFILNLTGGEIFLREDIREIYEGIMNVGLMVSILTNGTMITPETIDWLSKMPPVKVAITLYGATRETCARVTGYSDSYDKTVRAIDNLRSAGISVDLKTTIVRENMHEFDQLFQFARERDIPLGLVNYISPRREGCNSDPEENRLTPEELLQYENHVRLMNSSIENEKKEKVAFEDSTADYSYKNNPNPEFNYLYGAFRCAAGRSGAWVTWDGRMMACALLTKPVTYPLKQGFLNAWKELQEQCSLIPPCEECLSCKYFELCESCPARLLNETGSFIKPAPYLCEITRGRFNSMGK